MVFFLFVDFKRVLFIINPTSGKMKSKANFFDIINTMSENDCVVTVRITTKLGDATEFAVEACNCGLYDHIVCCGGDGTLNETMAGILTCENKLPLGYIPSGSTNDYARTLGIPSDVVEASAIAVTGEHYSIDVGCMDGFYFNYVASFGVFTSVSYNASQSMKNVMGHLAYVLEGVIDLTKIKSIPVKVKADNVVYEGNYIFGAIANTTSIGGLLKIKETLVSLNDGVFEICLVKEPKNPADVLNIIRGIMNSEYSTSSFEFFKASNLEITVPENLAWSLDGEKYISGPDVSVRIIHDAAKIVR